MRFITDDGKYLEAFQSFFIGAKVAFVYFFVKNCV